jgi:group II intron reverse transcriptase/maturase
MAARSLGKAVYIVTEDDRLWLQSVQRRLYARSRETPDYVFEELWGLVTDLRNLRTAFSRVHGNRGARTSGIDRVTVRKVVERGVEPFLVAIREELRSGLFRPSPVRRVLIPKAGKPGSFRPLGIPTVKDRVIQAAMKNILEPIFEAGFYPVSYGFRPGRSVRGALAHLKDLLIPRGMKRWGTAERPPFQWAIEGDIRGCFDHIDHHGLMERVRRRVNDGKLNRLIVAFLKSGVLSDAQFTRTDSGTPQGGILSPLLANIALSVIEERYERYVWPRTAATRRRGGGRPTVTLTNPAMIAKRAHENRARDKMDGLPVFMPIRYADDFIILVATRPSREEEGKELAEREKAALAAMLSETLGLSLSEHKTLITPVTSTMSFLGHHLRVRRHPTSGRLLPRLVIPKDRSQRLRRKVTTLFHIATKNERLADRLKQLNPILRGWASFYRHAWGAKRVFTSTDNHVWWTILRWLHKKHPGTPMRVLAKQYGWHRPRRKAMRWQDNGVVPTLLSTVRVAPYIAGSDPGPNYA